MPIVFTFFVEESPVVEPLSFDTLLITFSDEVVVDDVYLDAATYAVEIIEGEGDVSIRRVLPPNGKTTNQVILVVDKPRDGTHYRVTATDLNGRDGAPIGGSSDFIGRRTKTGNMIRALPKHFDKRPESLIATILFAVGISDDLIGGSRDDTFL